MTQKRTIMTDKHRKDNQPYDIDVIPAQSHPTKRTKTINKLVLLALIIIASSIGVFLTWSFESEQILEVKNSPVPTIASSDPAIGGTLVVMTVDYCKHRDVDGKLRMSYVSDSREIFLPIEDERGPAVCRVVETPVLVPKDLPADRYTIKFRVTYNLNPLKKGIIEEYESREFQINPR